MGCIDRDDESVWGERYARNESGCEDLSALGDRGVYIQREGGGILVGNCVWMDSTGSDEKFG